MTQTCMNHGHLAPGLGQCSACLRDMPLALWAKAELTSLKALTQTGIFLTPQWPLHWEVVLAAPSNNGVIGLPSHCYT